MSKINNIKYNMSSYHIFRAGLVFASVIFLFALEGCSTDISTSANTINESDGLVKAEKSSDNRHNETKTYSGIKNDDVIEVTNTILDTDAYNDESTDKSTDKSTDTNSLTLIMVGDILLHDAVNKCFEKEKGVYDYLPIFKNNGEEIEAADIAIVNQEVIIGGEGLGVTGYPSFNAPYEIGDALADAGFDIVCHATNHVMDRGKKGLINCLDYWEEQHPEIEVLGIHETEEDSEKICVYEQNGIKVAFLNYTYGTNGINPPTDMKWSVDLLNNKEKIVNDIRKAEELADITVVCPHWGTEYSLAVSDEQEKWTKVFLENGVDLVIGTHPHVIEPVEWVEDNKTGNRMLVYYSLGNYVNWTSGEGPGTSNRMVGGMARIDIGYDDSGRVSIRDYGVEALVCHLKKEKEGIKVYRLRDYTEELAQENAIRLQDGEFSLDYCLDLCDEVWGNLWE